jgi:hypothetical protein
MGYAYKDVVEYPWINIECGVRFLRLCYKKAHGNQAAAYEYYNRGLWWKTVERDSTDG